MSQPTSITKLAGNTSGFNGYKMTRIIAVAATLILFVIGLTSLLIHGYTPLGLTFMLISLIVSLVWSTSMLLRATYEHSASDVWWKLFTGYLVYTIIFFAFQFGMIAS